MNKENKKYDLVIYPNEVLSKKCEDVKLPLSKEDEELLNAMYDFVKNHETAVGLAAPQFGVNKRMLVIRYKYPNGQVFNCKMVNPRILTQGQGRDVYVVVGGESCLSEPDLRVEVIRKKHVVLMGYDVIAGGNVYYPLHNFVAAIAQHEVDHLNGILLHNYIKEEKDGGQ